MEAIKQSRGTCKAKFTRKCKLLEGRLLQDDHPEVLQDIFGEIVNIFTQVEDYNDQLLDLLSVEKTKNASIISEAEAYILEIEKWKTDLYVEVVKRKAIKPTSVKVKALPHPEFSGDIRKFGTFTKDYERLMVPLYGRDPYALLKCLTGDALNCVMGVEDNFDAMILRLKTMYGNPCKITDSIVKDIKSLTLIPEGDSKKFFSL